ncbi:uncharacterized protein LOC111711897 isoform X2 [Eurytemora carolleeae]|uniref:uncharacterized protein LOC111711897 isoform X2 n=1 Tax=Eurytemora carolleeae TaxID=1294199 RepID=UPI000C7752FE|nr:uncharacterized protein LOC111711897 isoform X2 [Eurytemora carolleeae]XP_023342139.1 uncharacterized protein LOC111711897 isoform X2 [Eurytemora carolleeae]|eukprot:XP_023342138.1 uncharacterized protein LOC111711897 isoform X2 [Eurytemora affinis]
MRYLCKQPHYSISGCRLVEAENTMFNKTQWCNLTSFFWISALLIYSVRDADALGRNMALQSSELCDVTNNSIAGEGFNIVSKERCNQFCTMNNDCAYWTWYKSHNTFGGGSESSARENVCYALNTCHLITEKCLDCASGKRTVAGTKSMSAEVAAEMARKIIEVERKKRNNREDL